MSPGPSAHELVDGLGDRRHRVAVLGLLALRPRPTLRRQRPVADLDRERAAGDLDDGGGHAVRVREVRREPVRVDRRRRDDDLEVRALRQQPREVAEDEVDVQRPLVGLVDDERVVGPQHRVALDLREQDAVGHHLDQRLLATTCP